MKDTYIQPTLVLDGHVIRTIEIEEVPYISARGIVEVFNLDFRKQKKQLLEPDSVILYGVIDISTPEFAIFANLGSPKTGRHVDLDDNVFLRMDRAMMFIARVSTANMRANGNIKGANAILALQLKFAQALHDFQMMGIAINRDHIAQSNADVAKINSIVKMVYAKNRSADGQDRKLLARLIGSRAADLGIEYQSDLLDDPSP